MSLSLMNIFPTREDFSSSFNQVKFCTFQRVSKKSSAKGDIRERWEPEHRD